MIGVMYDRFRRVGDQRVMLRIRGFGRRLKWVIEPNYGRHYSGEWIGSCASCETFALTYVSTLLKTAPREFAGKLVPMHDRSTGKGLLFEIVKNKLVDTGLTFNSQAEAEAYANEVRASTQKG